MPLRAGIASYRENKIYINQQVRPDKYYNQTLPINSIHSIQR